ncbi:F-box protein CPR1-like [Silene latifolia]|uniref:F-box protein CPR1-like n=1 Tax=Silene latifolia TaxID=37657 RepID=UPI003D7762AF
MVIPTLPSDIITNILSRLPSKTLIRFKSVSKQWYSIINSPYFINLHLSQTLISDNYPNLITCKDTLFSSPISDNYPHKNRFVQRILGSINGVLSLFSSSSSISDDHTNPNFHFSKLDHHYKHRFFRILGSINGVLCISLSDHRSVVLCNPSTKTHHLIPPFTPSPYTNLQCQEIKESPGHDGNPVNILFNIVVYGFGFDSVTRDYKPVRMIETREDNVTVYRESSVYSLKNDSWKCVNDQTLLGQFFLQKDRVVFVNEVLHFIVVDTTDHKLKIKCFNLKTETFSIFDLPMMLDDRFSLMMSSYFRELGGCFSVFVNYQKFLEGLEQADLWVMKEYGNEESWFRLFCISDPAMLYGFSRVRSCVRAVVYSKDKKRVLLEFNNGSSFCWYSWGNNTFERITVHGWPYGDYAEPYKSCFTWTFLDSLVLLGKDKSVGKNRAKEEKNK